MTNLIARPRVRFRPRRVCAAAAVGLLLLLASAEARASTHDLRRKRSEVEQQRAKVAAEVDALKASDRELEQALGVLQSNLATQESRLAAAKRAVAAAAETVRIAKERELRTAAELAALRVAMRRVAVDAYVRGTWEVPDVPAGPTTAGDLARRSFLLDTVVRRDADVADRLRTAKLDLTVHREAAEVATRNAATRRREVETSVGSVRQAVVAKEKVEDQVELRIERALSEADALRALDAQLAAEITSRQQALARRIAASRSQQGRGSGGSRRVGNISLTTVRGFTVAASIGPQVEGLLSAAEADGIVFGGGGYRNSDQQVATRRANCGSSNYDVYEKPASQCSPPTARPGFSMHEQGLAIDFTQDGRILNRSMSGYTWLKGNASRFGLYNLPSEPWHWSTNGN